MQLSVSGKHFNVVDALRCHAPARESGAGEQGGATRHYVLAPDKPKPAEGRDTNSRNRSHRAPQEAACSGSSAA